MVLSSTINPNAQTIPHSYRGGFEVHVTVRPANEVGLEGFRDWCGAHACKCVRIVLARGDYVEQPMATWRRHGTTLPVVLEEAHRAAEELVRAGIPVVRVKVEADPHNDDVPEDDADVETHPASNYFEHHVKLRRAVAAGRDRLLQTALDHGAHLSRNAWRQPLAGQEERFVTLRCYRVGRASSARQMQQLLAALTELGEQILETESEYTVHDTNLDLDAGWLPSGSR